MKSVVVFCLVIFVFFTSCHNAVEKKEKVMDNLPAPMEFEHVSLPQAIEIAKSQNKKIFIDFYTQWCGPCLRMAEEVFTDKSVGYFYNQNFINLKIDAETKEGKLLAIKYKVTNFPTFIFIDPHSNEYIHRSGCNQNIETFIWTGQCALSETKTEPYLKNEWENGNREISFLYDYANYLGSIYKRKEVAEIIDVLVTKGEKLEGTNFFNLFCKYETRVDHTLSDEFLSNRKYYIELYGAEKVDDKVYSLLSSTDDSKIWEKTGEFKGREFLSLSNEVSKSFYKGDYQTTIKILDELIENPKENLKDICDLIIRFMKYRRKDAPQEWLDKSLLYAQFVAYNYPDRHQGSAHFTYAFMLEQHIKRINKGADLFPDEIVNQPNEGKKDYTMRSPKLKRKPGYDFNKSK